MNALKEGKVRSRVGVIAVVAVLGLVASLGLQRQVQAKKAHEPLTHPSGNTSIKLDSEADRRATELRRPAREALDLAYDQYNGGDLAGCLKSADRAIILAKQPGVSANATVLRAERLSGRVLLEMGKPREALAMLQKHWRPKEDTREVDLDIALCHIRLGDRKLAAQFYSDQAILGHSHMVTRADLPSPNTVQSLEARILLARGGSSFSSGRREEAARNYAAALRLAPSNALAHYRLAISLPVERRSDRSRHFAYALVHGSSKIREKAQAGLAMVDRESQIRAMAAVKSMR